MMRWSGWRVPWRGPSAGGRQVGKCYVEGGGAPVQLSTLGGHEVMMMFCCSCVTSCMGTAHSGSGCVEGCIARTKV